MAGARRVSQTRKLPVRSTRGSRRAPAKEDAGETRGGLAAAALADSAHGGGRIRESSLCAKLTSEEVDEARELLRQFDMTMRYGPCVGVPRTSRWERALRFGLDPPARILEILQDTCYQGAIPDIEDNLWYEELN